MNLPDPNHFSSIGWLLVSLGALIFSANQALRFWDRMSGRSRPTSLSDQPITVKGAPEFVLKTECSQHMTGITREIVRIDGDVKRVDGDLQKFKADVIANGEKRKNFIVGLVEEKHNSSTSHIERVREELSADISKVHARVDTVPDRVIALLRNTGHLKGGQS